jgi:hypothetical protein
LLDNRHGVVLLWSGYDKCCQAGQNEYLKQMFQQGKLVSIRRLLAALFCNLSMDLGFCRCSSYKVKPAVSSEIPAPGNIARHKVLQNYLTIFMEHSPS